MTMSQLSSEDFFFVFVSLSFKFYNNIRFKWIELIDPSKITSLIRYLNAHK